MNDFKQLITAIKQVHQWLQAQAAGAVNRALTLRNWLIGYYIVEFEQKGHERATYGLQLLEKIASTVKINGISATNLKLFRQFYPAYPKLSQTVSDQLQPPLPAIQNNQPSGIPVTVPSEKIISRLSFSHLIELSKIEDLLKRCFYEIECITCTWSVRELKRQINSLYHALVKYATAGMDENLFIKKYLIRLPDKEQLEHHIEKELKKLQ